MCYFLEFLLSVKKKLHWLKDALYDTARKRHIDFDQVKLNIR